MPPSDAGRRLPISAQASAQAQRRPRRRGLRLVDAELQSTMSVIGDAEAKMMSLYCKADMMKAESQLARSAERGAPKTERRTPSAQRPARSTERRAPSAERRAPSAQRGAPSAKREHRRPSAESSPYHISSDCKRGGREGGNESNFRIQFDGVTPEM